MLASSHFSLFFSQTQEIDVAQSLTLQFLISELLKSHQELLIGNKENLYSPISYLFPYDWTLKAGHLTKFYECSKTLESIFPSCSTVVSLLNKVVSKTTELCSSKRSQNIEQQLQFIQSSLEPLIAHCCQDENLFLFLLKHQKQIDSLMHPSYLYNLLVKIHPEGLEVVGEKLCDQYHRRGFFSPISECKLLLTQLLHERLSTPTCL